MTDNSQNNPALSPPTQRRGVLVLLLVLQGISALSLLLWLVSFFAVSLADNISQLESRHPILPFLVQGQLLYPVLSIGTTLLAWRLYSRRKGLAAVIVTIVVLLLAVAFFSALWSSLS